MKDWWETLQTRERYMVLAATALVVFTILYFAIWTPISSGRDNKQNRVEAKQETVAWMMQKKQEVEHLKRINPNMFNRSNDSRSLLAVVDTGAKQMGVRPAITRIQPKDDDSVQIWFEDIAFDYLIVLLGELQRRNNIDVADVSLDRSEQVGKVSGKVTLIR